MLVARTVQPANTYSNLVQKKTIWQSIKTLEKLTNLLTVRLVDHNSHLIGSCYDEQVAGGGMVNPN